MTKTKIIFKNEKDETKEMILDDHAPHKALDFMFKLPKEYKVEKVEGEGWIADLIRQRLEQRNKEDTT